MNVGNSVRKAIDDWGSGEQDAAMLHVCNAVDGTAKMVLRSELHDLTEFAQSVSTLDGLQIVDAALEELRELRLQCTALGFGSMPKKGSKARRYFDDLKSMVALSTGAPLTSLRDGYIREAWPALKRLSSVLVALAPFRDLDDPP